MRAVLIGAFCVSLLLLCLTSTGCGLAVLPFNVGYNALYGRPGEYGVTGARFASSGNGKVIFSYMAPKDATQHLYEIDIETDEITQLTHGERFDFNPLPSPDGRFVLFTSKLHSEPSKKRRQHLYILDRNEGEINKLTSRSVSEWAATWSPSGDRIAFVSSYAIYLINPDGTDLSQLTNKESVSFMPAFCLDDSSVFFWKSGSFGHASPIASSTYHDFRPHLIDVNSLAIRELPFGKSKYRLAMSAVSLDGLTAIWRRAGGVELVNLKAPFARTVLEPSGDAYHRRLENGRRVVRFLHFPEFSPDSSSVLFGLTRPGEIISRGPNELHIIDLATNQASLITDLGMRTVEAHFSSDGEWIIVRANVPSKSQIIKNSLFLIRSDGSEVRPIDVSFGD